MKLTLASLHTEMKSGFAAVNKRIDDLDKNVNERIDRIAFKLDGHIEDTNFRFREVNDRFKEVDRRFDAIDQRFDAIDQRFEKIDQRFDAVDRHFNELIEGISHYSSNIEKMLANHDQRITALEAR